MPRGTLARVLPAGRKAPDGRSLQPEHATGKRPLYVQNTCLESIAKIKSATMSMRVAVLGGGVGGLSAAHELIERGFDVSVYERRDVIGGEAGGLSGPNTGQEGRKDLPGGPSFRFFSSVYPHLPGPLKG